MKVKIMDSVVEISGENLEYSILKGKHLTPAGYMTMLSLSRDFMSFDIGINCRIVKKLGMSGCLDIRLEWIDENGVLRSHQPLHISCSGKIYGTLSPIKTACLFYFLGIEPHKISRYTENNGMASVTFKVVNMGWKEYYVNVDAYTQIENLKY